MTRRLSLAAALLLAAAVASAEPKDPGGFRSYPWGKPLADPHMILLSTVATDNGAFERAKRYARELEDEDLHGVPARNIRYDTYANLLAEVNAEVPADADGPKLLAALRLEYEDEPKRDRLADGSDAYVWELPETTTTVIRRPGGTWLFWTRSDRVCHIRAVDAANRGKAPGDRIDLPWRPRSPSSKAEEAAPPTPAEPPTIPVEVIAPPATPSGNRSEIVEEDLNVQR